MKGQKIISRCCQVVGGALLFGALYRALSLNNLVVAARTGDIPAHLAASILIDWCLAALLLALVGCWLFFLSRDIQRGNRQAIRQAALIGATLLLFGAGCWYQYPTSIHLLVFIFLGGLLLCSIFFLRNKE